MILTLTYLDFLAGFLAVPLSILGVVAVGRRWPNRPATRVQVGGLVLMLGLALTYTTPWDNYLIARGVWWYGDGRVAATIWQAPVEEYLFIALQTLLVGLWTFQVAGPVHTDVNHTTRDRVVGALAGFGVAGAGALFLDGPQSTFYLGAILLWAGPVLALQWAVGWRYVLRVRRRAVVAVAVPVGYLCLIDRIAIAEGIWTISRDYTTGLTIAGLPIEEAVFFLLTSTFVVQALVLLRWVVETWD